MELGILSKKYESNGDPAIVSAGTDDFGGRSYGLYQLASNCGSVDEFLGWGARQGGYYSDYAKALIDCAPVNSDEFVSKWREIGTIDPDGFGKMQHDYIKHAYYDIAERQLLNQGFHLAKHSFALQNAVWSASVQYGNGWDDEYNCPNIVRLFIQAMPYIPCYEDYMNLTYFDDSRFDYDLIVGIYETRKQHPWIWHTNTESVKESLRNRFEQEKIDALNMLMA